MPIPVPAPAHSPEDWPAMRQALYDWARAEVPASVEVIWAQQPAPAPPQPYVWLSVILPPTKIGHDDVRNAVGLAVQVKTATPDPFAYSVQLTELDGTVIHDLSTTFPGSPTTSDVASGLAALVDALGDFSASVLDWSPDAFRPTRDNGAPFLVRVTEPELATKVIQQTVGRRQTTFQVDVVAPKPALDAADPIADADLALRTASLLQNSLESPNVLERLHMAGWGVIGVEGNRKPDQVAGSLWEDRAGFDLRLSCRGRRRELVDWIESVVILAQGSGIVVTGTVGS